jgi:hypothetical protein
MAKNKETFVYGGLKGSYEDMHSGVVEELHRSRTGVTAELGETRKHSLRKLYGAGREIKKAMKESKKGVKKGLHK